MYIGFCRSGVECQETCYPVPLQLADKVVVTRYFPTSVVIVWLYDPLGQKVREVQHCYTKGFTGTTAKWCGPSIPWHTLFQRIVKKIFDASILNAGKCIIALLWKSHRAFGGKRMAGRWNKGVQVMDSLIDTYDKFCGHGAPWIALHSL